MSDENDGDYETGFSFEGLTGIEEEDTEEKVHPLKDLEKVSATLADFPVSDWNNKNDAQHIVDWYNDLAKEREIEQLSFRDFMNMTGNRHFDSINDAQDFLDFALMILNGKEFRLRDHTYQTPPVQGTWAGLAIFWVITLVVCTASVFVTGWIVGAIAADLETGDWTPVDGIITDSGVDESYDQNDEGSTSYCLWVEYEYTIENRTYDGSTLSHSRDGSCSSLDANADDEYPPGKNVTVYVNPDNPDESVLLPGWSGIDILMCCFFIFPLVAIVLFGSCCKATYNSIMYPEKYIVNFASDDTSTTRPPIDPDEDSTRSSGLDLDGDGIADDLYGVPQNNVSIIDKIAGDVKSPAAILQTVFALIVVNGFLFLAFTSESAYAAEFDVANEAMEGTSEWPSTTAVFSDNFTISHYQTGEEYFSGSIIIYCSNTSESWECGDEESGYERIEIPYRCTRTEQVGPLENPCDWAMQMFVVDSYWSNYGEDLWVVYEQCEWEGEPEDENLWSCYYIDILAGHTSEYDTWWFYCEHHLNESLWYCTDEFGEEISSPDNQNGTLYQSEIETTVNYDPDDPTRIAFVEGHHFFTESDGFPIIFIIFPIIINLVLIGRIVVPIIRRHEAFESFD